MFFKAITVAAVVVGVAAQRPTNTSICDYYTTALLKNNTAANQQTLLTLVVNTAVIGNYTTPNVGIAVPGILTPGEYNGTQVNLLPYFDGGLASTNTGGTVGRSVNFLDGGGAAPLKINMPANDTSSHQYILLTHLYEYFGDLLGCTLEGSTGFSAYSGSNSMYEVHKFMDLSPAEVGYFITQVALSAASFGVAQSDLTVVGTALNSLFGYRCAPPAVVIPNQPSALQAICVQDSCPISPNAVCASYNATVLPSNSTSTTGASTTSTSGSSGPSPTTSSPAIKAGASTVGISFTVLAGAFAVFFL